MTRIHSIIAALLAITLVTPALAEPPQYSGIYPHLTMYNQRHLECGTGAVVPWADRLWVITYAPSAPYGSTDKLYEITPELEQIIRPESVGGTHANRMIHRESNQLNIGLYLIDADRNVRALSPKAIPGRQTGTARHLIDPKNKIYIATMEEGLYTVDVNTLEVTEHIMNASRGSKPIAGGIKSKLPGAHGKGLYTGQGRLIYSNNGEDGRKKMSDPLGLGALADWKGEGDWQLIRRNQFTEVTGPGGIYGNENPETDPIWAMGWDHRSLVLMLLEKGKWHAYRLPKASHSYDGAHGWNTEWPRIREIGEKNMLATMHGTFWRFPKTFSTKNSAGIEPRSNYLKVIGDFAWWNDRIVFGCDDSAKSEFLNRRPFKADRLAALQSNSNLWFVKPGQLDELGPAIGRGSVLLRDDVEAGKVSEPYLFNGYDHRMMTVRHATGKPVKFTLEVDERGNGRWRELETFDVEKSLIHIFPSDVKGIWVRVKTDIDAESATVHFHYRNKDSRPLQNDSIFAPLAKIDKPAKTQGQIRGEGQPGLRLHNKHGEYQLNAKMELRPVDPHKDMFSGVDQPKGGISVDDASVIVREGRKAYRVPKNDAYRDFTGRLCREVVTERDLFNIHGTFYELPALNAGGFAKVRPVATHNLAIDDYASQFGLFIMTGLNGQKNEHVIRSEDGKAAVWVGALDDLWRLGKPRGKGGPWKDTKVKARVPSDPYLMTGYDQKSVRMEADKETEITLQVDIDGTGLWVPYRTFALSPEKAVHHRFPEGFSAYWVRAISGTQCKATVMFEYK